MAKEFKSKIKGKKVDIKVQTKEGEVWERMVAAHKQVIKNCEDEILIAKEYLKVAEAKCKEEEAKRWLDIALSKDSNNHVVRYLLAKYYVFAGKDENAFPILDELLNK